MANEADVTVRVKTIDDGSRGMQTYAKSLGGVKVSALAFAGTLGAAAIAGKKLYDTLRAGAQLETTALRFDKLTKSIGTTAETMMGKLRTATQGMVSDMDLMAGASEIMSLKLATNQEQVIRLAKVVGVLGWDMRQVVLTFANLSTMRLDALGLSVTDVETKAKELKESGMSAADAFKEAVILAGEARLDVGGVSEQEKAFKQLETAIANTRNELSLMLVQLADNTGVVGWLSNLAKNIELNRQLEQAYQAGRISAAQYEAALIKAAEAPGKAGEALTWLNGQLEDNNIVLLSNQNAWAAWASGVAIQAAEAEAQATAAMTAIFRNIVSTNSALTAWTAGAGAGVGAGMGTGPLVSKNNAYAWFKQATAMYRENDLARAREVGSLQNVTRAYGGYSSALSEAEKAEQEAIAMHERLVSAFDAEINYVRPKDKNGNAGPDTSLIGDDGLVIIENVNKALYEQSKAAGTNAIQLALLGAATGQFTEEQAEAALKAAVLQERIVQLAKGIASGQISFQDALGGLGTFKQSLDATGAGSLPETVAQLVAGIPADDRTIAYLSDTSVVDDDLRRLRGTVVEIPVRYSPINDPTQTRGGAIYISPPTIAPPPVTPVNPIIAPPKPPRPPKPPYDPTRMDIQMNLNFHGPANANDVKNGVTEGMKSFFDGLRIEGVPV